ncbi:MAG: hypothetical protein DRN33_04625 [Thermoplasmata archaeon]|nr:MAG: hypothetical protein DRN33_04625 [Thermoplasmata archaeon]
MVSEAETIIAFVFKRSGKKEISFPMFYLTLSMDLNWFTPNDAKKFIQKALTKKLLIKKKELLMPSFDVEKIDIPTGFTPSGKIVFEEKIKEKKEEDVLTKIIKKISREIGLPEEEVLRKINNFEKEKNIVSEIAVLLLGKENNVDVSEFLPEVEEKIFED